MGFEHESMVKPKVLPLDIKDIEELRYFIKYRFNGVFSRRFLYAFLDAFLFFLPTFGLLLNVFSKLILTTAFAGISLAILPFSPLYLVAGFLVTFIAMSFVMSIFKGKESYNKCKQSYDNENELIFDIVKFKVFVSLFNKYNVELPGNINSELVKPNYNKVPLSARIKSYSLTALLTLLGSMSLLSTLGAVTGISVGSTALLLGPVSPLLISAVLVVANVGLVLWFKSFFETDFIEQSEKQRALKCNYQAKIELLYYLAYQHRGQLRSAFFDAIADDKITISKYVSKYDSGVDYYNFFKGEKFNSYVEGIVERAVSPIQSNSDGADFPITSPQGNSVSGGVKRPYRVNPLAQAQAAVSAATPITSVMRR